VEDTSARGHPLHVARAERAGVAERVVVRDRAGEDVGDRLDAAVRKSLSSSKGSNSSVSPEPNARRSFTPSPSRVGMASTMRFTGRMDKYFLRIGRLD
jgi:hypothetical protein